jgi:hypothetical protein
MKAGQQVAIMLCHHVAAPTLVLHISMNDGFRGCCFSRWQQNIFTSMWVVFQGRVDFVARDCF